jgi:DNA-binding XRE family transcriptional regulator
MSSIGTRKRIPLRYNLFIARIGNGLSSRDIGKMLGISHEAYLNIEHGWTKKIDYRVAQKLVEMFGMRPEELFAGKEFSICENKRLFKKPGLSSGGEDRKLEFVCIQA